MMLHPLSRRLLLRQRAAIAWLRAFDECLKDRRPHSIIKTEWVTRGMLI
jgi:hypothetical protein